MHFLAFPLHSLDLCYTFAPYEHQFMESYRLQLWGAWVCLSVSPAPLAGSSKSMHRSGVSSQRRITACAQSMDGKAKVPVPSKKSRIDAGPILSWNRGSKTGSLIASRLRFRLPSVPHLVFPCHFTLTPVLPQTKREGRVGPNCQLIIARNELHCAAIVRPCIISTPLHDLEGTHHHQ